MDRRLWALAALAVSLAGCAGGTGDQLGRSLVAPGGYDFYDCAQLAVQEKNLVNRDKELSRLIQRAHEGAAGGFVSAIAYDSEYASNAASLRQVRLAQVDKNCTPAAIPTSRTSDGIVR